MSVHCMLKGEVFGGMADVWVEEVQRTCYGEEVMRVEEGVVQSRVIVWVERVVRGGRREGRLVICDSRGAAAVRGRGVKSVGAERGAGSGAVGSC